MIQTGKLFFVTFLTLPFIAPFIAGFAAAIGIFILDDDGNPGVAFAFAISICFMINYCSAVCVPKVFFKDANPCILL